MVLHEIKITSGYGNVNVNNNRMNKSISNKIADGLFLAECRYTFDLKFSQWSTRRVSNFFRAAHSLHINKKNEQTAEDISHSTFYTFHPAVQEPETTLDPHLIVATN